MAAMGVASLGAFFSITGLGALFSGAVIAVWLMAGSLEFAKFVLAAYLHQTWKVHNAVYKSYLTFAIVILSVITSVGIYGFLSDAYQSASLVLETETVKLESIKTQQSLLTAELSRLNKMVEEIPATRVTKRMKMRAELEPAIQEINKKYNDGERILTQSNLKIIEVKKKVGPLIYIAKAFNMNIDHVVSALILVLVSVFDPLAICLVIAATHAIESYRKPQTKTDEEQQMAAQQAHHEPAGPAPVKLKQQGRPAIAEDETDDVIVQMNFKDESEDKKVI